LFWARSLFTLPRRFASVEDWLLPVALGEVWRFVRTPDGLNVHHGMKAARRPHRQCGRAGAVHGSIAPASTSEGGRPPADGPAATGSEPWARAGPIRAERGARCPERRHADLRRARCADLRFGRDAVASATRRAVPSAHASRQERPLSSASAAAVAGLRLLHRIGMQRGLI
jgi:hypothetical protein